MNQDIKKSATFEEYQSYMEQRQKQAPSDGATLNPEELVQVAGGTYACASEGVSGV